MQMLNVQSALRELTVRLQLAGLPSPEVDARELVMLALGFSRTELLTRAGQVLSADEWQVLDALTRRREAREPLQHLLGEIEWAGLRLRVSPAALIPRPETEGLLLLALGHLRSRDNPRVLDVGTGTGALALGFKQLRPDAEVTASDISGEALALARQNAERNGLDVSFVQADLLTGVSGPFELLLSNPPYLPQSDALAAQPEVAYDPALALYSGPDGLMLARRLMADAVRVLAPGGGAVLELDPRNVGVLAAELSASGWNAEVHRDLSGRERFLSAWKA